MLSLAASNMSGRQTEKLLVLEDPEPVSNCYCRQKKKSTTKTNSQLRSIALIFFLLACLYWLYKAYTNATGGLSHSSGRTNSGIGYQTKLKLISVFNRHGDRSPSDLLPHDDEFSRQPKFFWPNGLTNLTDSGKFRQFRIGLELRKRYEELLDYNASHYLAFSSHIFRCQESLEHTLRGIFDIDWPLSRGLKLIDQYNADAASSMECLAATINTNTSKGAKFNASSACSQRKHLILPSGTGSPLEYELIKIDTKTVPTLNYQFLNNCKYRLQFPSLVDANLSASDSIAELRGIQRLKNILATKYGTAWKFEALGLHSTLAGEIRVARTRESINYGHRNYEWITQPVTEYNSTRITLFDLYEQVVLLGYRDRIVGTADYIQLGPIISSMVESQRIALGQSTSNKSNPKMFRTGNFDFDSAELYSGKKAVIYSTHDSILQLLLHRLGFIRANEADYESRFKDWHEADDVEQFLAGLRMSKFGMSLVFELYEIEMAPRKSEGGDDSGETKLAFVQASLYNQEDGKYSPIEYRRLKLGKLCQHLFQEQNPDSTWTDEEDSFYNEEFKLDRDLSCPFELFTNVTNHYMITSTELDRLCRT